MKYGVLLPNTNLYGGVKRFFELGNVFINLGHEFIVFTPDGVPPTWYYGNVITMNFSAIEQHKLDALFITETRFVNELVQANAKRKIFYFVRTSDDLKLIKKNPEIEVFANSINGFEIARDKYKINAFKAYGGINTKLYFAKKLEQKIQEEPFVVMCFGRLVEKKKGTRLVVKACESLYKKGYNIKLVLFDTPVNDKAKTVIENFETKVPFEFIVNHPVTKNVELYHKADVYVAAEKKAGYCNTGAEAMASGIPLIATTSGTKDFLINNETGIVVKRWSWKISRAILTLMNDFEKRKELANNGRKLIENFDWEILGKKIVNHLTGNEQL